MNEFISRNALLDAMPKNDELSSLDVRKVICSVPTADVILVRHGRWVKANGMMPPEYHGRKCCSVCDAFALSDFYGRERLSDFCPNCGAKMDLEEQINE